MRTNPNPVPANRSGADGVLGRGSRILVLASVAGACGQRAGKGPWYVLSDQLVGPTESVLEAIDAHKDSAELESAVRAALSANPATILPAWVASLLEDPGALDRIGESFEADEVKGMLGSSPREATAGYRGLAALAVSFCRSRDHLASLSRFLGKSDGERLQRTGALANVTVRPGVPSRLRKQLRGLAKTPEEGGDG